VNTTTTQPRPPTRLARRAAAPLVALLALGACSGDDADTTTADTDESTASTIGTDTTMAGADTTMAMETTAPAAETTTASSAPQTTAAPATTAPTTTAPASTVPAPFEFADPGGSYTATFPGEPTPVEQATALPDGTELPITFYLFQDPTGAAFGTASIAYPEGTTLDLQGAQDGAIASVQGTLVESVPIELQGRTGLQFAADVGGQGTYVSRIFADGLNLYQVVAVVQGSVTAADPTVAAFLDSFQFTT